MLNKIKNLTAVFCAVSICFSSPAFANTLDQNSIDLIDKLAGYIKESYVDEVNNDKMVEGALNGMLSNLDPFSAYLPPKSYQELQVQTSGHFGGIGVEIMKEDAYIKIISPLDDTPAFFAGVKSGDYITHIDEKSVIKMSLLEAVDKMRGEAGTKIVLRIVRKGLKKPIDVELTRAIIHVKSVKFKEENDIEMIRISSFTEDTTAELKSSISAMERKNKNVKGIILDLRNDPGGLLNQAVDVSDLFLKNKESIVAIKGRKGVVIKEYKATNGRKLTNKPMVVLINEGSASASEIVSGALRDNQRAVLVGQKSYGKGSVQTVIPLDNGGAIKMTIAKYYTPSGKSIHELGITPDVIVAEQEDENVTNKKIVNKAANPVKNFDTKTDKQLQKAIEILTNTKEYSNLLSASSYIKVVPLKN